MVGPAYDCLSNPLGAVRLTFQKKMATMGSAADPNSFNGIDWGACDLFRHFLFDPSHLSQVPVLNPSTMKWVQPNTLVRFRGMIQDMLGNEFYVGAFKDGSVWKTNKFTDVSQFPMSSSPDVRVWERRLLYCVPVPGLNSWADDSPSEVLGERCMDSTSQQGDKRPRMANEAIDHQDFHVSSNEFDDSPSAKRMRENEHSSAPPQSSASTTVGTFIAPAVSRDSLPCLVKIYDSPESALQLNDVFDFVGVLSLDSELAEEKDDDDELPDGFCEELAHFSPNKVPRLHCIVYRKLAVHDFLPNSPIRELNPPLVNNLREALLRHLTVILGNDGLAAHFLLLHLLSKVHARVDNVAVGKLSLNLTRLTKESAPMFGSRLSIAVKNLLPFTHFMPLTVGCLNTSSLAPKKDYLINRLRPGVLQLPKGSHLIIDETQLETGNLNSVGVENARLLKELIEFQKVGYDFAFYKIDMDADVQLLILSDGKSNILPADVVVPLEPSSLPCSEIVGTEALEAWRWYLTTVRSLPHSIEPEMEKVIENDLVAARQADRSLGSQDFSRWLTMGRLISASYGETSLSLQHWQKVKELERQRTERVNNNK